MKIEEIQLELNSYTTNANTIKNEVLDRLLNDNVISEKQYQEYTTKWQIIIFKNAWHKRWFNTFSKEKSIDENGWSYKFVKFED